MRTFIAAAFAAVASAELLTSEDYEFIRFVSKFNKRYATTEEFMARKTHFINFFREMRALNEDYTVKSTHGLNKYSDNTPDEWKLMNGLKMRGRTDMQPVVYEGYEVPSSVDWRDAGCVNTIKDQGQCGSCWAFSATSALETTSCVATGTLESLSEQELVDCTLGYGNLACHGGWYYQAWDYLIAGNTQETEANYPYTATRGSCVNNNSGNVTATSYSQVSGDPDSIRAALSQTAQSVAIAAGNYYFQSYTGGILMDSSRCGSQLDHAVTAVGYGTENGTDYILVRNSWGGSWGEGGYVKMELTTGTGTCGVNQMVYTVSV